MSNLYGSRMCRQGDLSMLRYMSLIARGRVATVMISWSFSTSLLKGSRCVMSLRETGNKRKIVCLMFEIFKMLNKNFRFEIFQ